MAISNRVKPTAWHRIIVSTAGLYVLFGGLLTLIGWFADVPRLTDWNNNGIAMFVNTAICAVFGGAALLLLMRVPSHFLVRLLGGAVGLIGALTLFEHFSGINLGIDTLLANRPWGQSAAASPMRMGPPASCSFAILGTAIALAANTHRKSRIISAYLAMGVVAISMLSLMGYLYGARPMYSLPHLTGIAAQTASMLLALSVGLIAAIPESVIPSLARRNDPGGLLFRRFFLPIVLIPIVAGFLRLAGERAGFYDTAFGVALFVLTTVGCFSALLTWTSISLSRSSHSLRESEERLAGIIGSAMDAVIAVDEAQRIVVFNPAAEEVFGCPASQALGQLLDRFIPPQSRDVHRQYIEKFGQNGLTSRRVGALEALTAVRADGVEFPIEASMSQMETAGRKLFTVILRDITERTRAEVERTRLLDSERAARTEAEQASRLKDEFLATLSHELRNPLNAILGWIHLIERNNTDSKTVAEGIGIISRNAKLQADLIADLLDMSRIVSGKIRLQIEDVSLADVVMAAVDSVRHAAEVKGITIQPMVSHLPDLVPVDPARIQQVVWNLLSNALKFTPKGGRIQVVLTREDSYAEIIVSDTGIGIRLDFLPHVFERFRQADASTTRQHGGLGLGLSIVKQLVELHGGIVLAASDGDGRGATFTVRLPLALIPTVENTEPHQGERRKAAPQLACDSTDLTGIKVLAIDDQEDARELLKRVLEECHAQVITANSSDEALRALQHYRPHVVLCDIGLPSKDGYEFIKEMRGGGDCTPAVAVTAFARSEDRLRALRAGYQGHVAKPIEPAELIATVAAVAKPIRSANV